MKDADYYVISLADVKPNEEWIVGPPPVCDLALHGGELSLGQLMALVELAEVVVGGVGWIVPAAIAYNTPLFIVFGGRGGFDNMTKITDPRMDLSNVSYSLPKYFCGCHESQHNCNKETPDFEETFKRFLKKHE